MIFKDKNIEKAIILRKNVVMKNKLKNTFITLLNFIQYIKTQNVDFGKGEAVK